MAEIWKNRARKPIASGTINTGIIRGFVFSRIGNINELCVSLRIGEHYLVMTVGEFDAMQEMQKKLVKEFFDLSWTGEIGEVKPDVD